MVAQNKKARHDFHIEDTYEAGLVLVGTEVKSLRAGRASLVDGFADIENHEIWLHGVHIPEYSQGTWTNHSAAPQAQAPAQPRRDRQDRAAGQREGAHHRAARAVLQGRPRQGRDRARPRQEGLRQAAHPGREAGPSARPSRRSDAGSRASHGLSRPVATLSDADVPGWWAGLGLPGLVDVHVHFLPPRVMRKVREQFDTAGPLIGRRVAAAVPRRRRRAGRAAARARRTAVHRPALRPPPRHRGVPQRLGRRPRRRGARGARCRRRSSPSRCGAAYVAAADRGRHRGLQGARAGRRLRRARPAAARGLGDARGRRHPGGDPRQLRPGRHAAHRPRPAAGAAGGVPPADPGAGAHGRAALRRVHGGRGEVRPGASRHDDGVHRLLGGDGAVPAGPAAAAAGPPGQGAARLGLPQHPLPLRPPARGAGAARAR